MPHLLDLQFVTFRDVAPMALAIGISAMVPLLPIPRRRYTIAFAGSLAGIVVTVALTFVAVNMFDVLDITARYVVLFWAPVFVAPAVVVGIEILRRQRASGRGFMASLAFVSVYAAALLSHYFRTGGPRDDLAGTVIVIGWLLAPAAIIAVAYSLGVRKDDMVREARARAPGLR